MPRPVPACGGTLISARAAHPESDAQQYCALYQDARLLAYVGDVAPATPVEAASELHRLNQQERHLALAAHRSRDR